MDVRTATGEKFVLERAINRGGEAQIWTVRQDAHLVAKLYHQPTAEHQAKLTAMLATPLTRRGSHPTVAWPLHLLYRQNTFVGYLMPRAAGSLPLFHYYNPARRRRLGLPHAWPRFLHRTATNLAAAVELVHAHGHIIGDLNESNALVTPAALVTLVDTDSFQISTGPNSVARIPQWLSAQPTQQIYRCGVGKAEYTPPELQGVDFKSTNRTPYHDNFALAVLIFYLLMDGFHPFAGVLNTGASVGRVDLYGIKHGLFPYLQWGSNAHKAIQPPPNAPAFAYLHPGLQDGFRRTFIDGHAHPERRVMAKEWKNLLQEAEVALVACSQDKSHLFSRHLRVCPICMPKPVQQPSRIVHSAPAPVAQATGSASTPPPSSSAHWALSAWQTTGQQLNRLAQIKLPASRLRTTLHHIQSEWPHYVKVAQSTVAMLPDRFATAQRTVLAHTDLFGGWLVGNLTGTLLAGLVTVGGYILLPQLEALGPLSIRGQIILLMMLFATLLGTLQAYTLRRSLLPWPYLRYAWVGTATLTGAVVGTAGFRLLGPVWDQASAWSAQAWQVTTLAALFGVTLGFLQSLLLRQQLRLADDGRVWTIVNGISGILAAQGWLWGQSLPYTWSLAQVADWQLNAGIGALAGTGIGSLLSGIVLLWMVQGPRHNFRLRQFAFGLSRWPLAPTYLRIGVVRWVRAILLLILFWFLLQIVVQLNGAAALVAPPLPTEIMRHLAALL